jgi:hypothetical protein
MYLTDLLEQIRLGDLFGGTSMYIMSVVEFQVCTCSPLLSSPLRS